MAVPIIIALYFIWKCVTKFKGPLWVKIEDIDLMKGMREMDYDPNDEFYEKKSIGQKIKNAIF